MVPPERPASNLTVPSGPHLTTKPEPAKPFAAVRFWVGTTGWLRPQICDSGITATG